MDKQVAIRRVRIAVSVFSAVLIVALCVLWVRGYSHREGMSIDVSNVGHISTGFRSGRIRGLVVKADSNSTIPSAFRFSSRPGPEFRSTRPGTVDFGSRQFQRHEGFFEFTVPFWFPVLLISILSASVWLLSFPTKFSLRTMFIATTLVAVVLGLGVWLAS